MFESIEKITNRLQENNFDALVVGGAVRDIFLGNEPHDFDIATNATPQQIVELFKDDHKINLVGKSFGVIIIDGVEVATFRSDKYQGLNDKNVEIEFVGTFFDDASRRDLTINSLAICPNTGDVIDYFNGIEDTKERIIRFVGNPYERIYEDPNRIIRACRFLAKINGRFSKETLCALSLSSHLIKDHVAPERIRLEILKAMELNEPSGFFYALELIGALEYIFPSLSQCVDFPHGKNHFETVFEHNLLICDCLPKNQPLLRLAGLLHDVGKPCSAWFDPKINNIRFSNHEDFSVKHVKPELKNLRFSNEEINYICGVIASHMRSTRDLSKKSIRRSLKCFEDNNITYNDFLIFHYCDVKANLLKPDISNEEQENIIKSFEEVLNSTNSNEKNLFKLAINGNDIQRILNIGPGKKIGEINKFLTNLIIDNPEFNTIEFLTFLIKENFNN